MDALVLDGRYRIGERLGEGGMGAVWEAVDLRLERQVAVKVMSGVSVRRDPRAKDRFDREAKLLAGLASPYVVTVHDAGEAEVEGSNLLYLVMERLHGRSLAEVVEQELPTLDEVARWSEQICRALAVAHESGVVHRDLKPANVMVCADGLVRVLDFGIAAVLSESPDQARLTSTGLVVGTPAYMAPEQIESGTYDARSDLYSLGCMLYELLIGRPPFVGGALYALMRQHMTAVPELPSSLRPGVPAEWDALIMHLLTKDPADRPAVASEIARGLRQLPRPEVPDPVGYQPAGADPSPPPGYVPTRIDPRMAMIAPSAAPTALQPGPVTVPVPAAEPEPFDAAPADAPSAPSEPAEVPHVPADAEPAADQPAEPAVEAEPAVDAGPAADLPAAPELPPVPTMPGSPPAPVVPPVPAGAPEPWPLRLSLGQRSGPLPETERLAVRLEWTVAPEAEGEPEVDGSALAVDTAGQVLSDLHFVFYNNLALPSDHDEQGNGILLEVPGEGADGPGDGEGAAGGGGHRFLVEPGRLDAGTERIVFALSLHEAEERGQDFTMLSEMAVRVLDADDGRELCCFRLDSEAVGGGCGITVGNLYRTPRGWGFHARTGSYPTGLVAIAEAHGVNV